MDFGALALATLCCPGKAKQTENGLWKTPLEWRSMQGGGDT